MRSAQHKCCGAAVSTVLRSRCPSCRAAVISPPLACSSHRTAGGESLFNRLRSLRPALCSYFVCRLSSMRLLSVSRMQSASCFGSRIHDSAACLFWLHGRAHHGRAECGGEPTTECRTRLASTKSIDLVKTIRERFRCDESPEQSARKPGGATATAAATATSATARTTATAASFYRCSRSRSRCRVSLRVGAARRIVIQREGHCQQRIHRIHHDERGLRGTAAAAHRAQQQARLAVCVSRRGSATILDTSFDPLAQRWRHGDFYGLDHC